MAPGSPTTPSSDEKDLRLGPGPATTGKTGLVVSERDADVTLRLIEEHGEDFAPLSPEKEKKLQWKLYWRIMGLLSLINIMLFVCPPVESGSSLTAGRQVDAGLLRDLGSLQRDQDHQGRVQQPADVLLRR